MGNRDLGADLEHGVFGDAEFGEPRLRLDFGLGEVTTLRFRHILGFRGAHAELHRRIAIRLLRSHGDDLAVVDLQHRHRDVVALFGEDARHAELLSEETGTHRLSPIVLAGLDPAIHRVPEAVQRWHGCPGQGRA
jgi:hypothetical protein